MTEPEAPDPIEDLVAECLRQADTDGDSVVDRVCREHPGHADEIRARYRAVRDIGLLGRASMPGGVGMPERLGEFRLLRRIGEGGMGVVYLAEQASLGRRVALKLIRPEHLWFAGYRERFRREIEAVARLHHPGIVPIHSFGEQDGIPFFAMEYVEGPTLAELLVELEGRSPASLAGSDAAEIVGGAAPSDATGASRSLFAGGWADTAVRIAQRVAEALHHAHERGVLHRDVKPSNVVLVPDGRVVLLDFGLALAEGAGRLTRSGSQVGSLPYMSPEQIRGDPVDRRTDIYSVGVMLYETLTLRCPYVGRDAAELRRNILDGRPAAIRKRNRAVSWDAETVCGAAMDRDPRRRYATARELAGDLDNLLQHRTIRGRRPSAVLRTRRWAQRHPAVTVALALLLVVVPATVLWQQASHIRQLGLRMDLLRLGELESQMAELGPWIPGRVRTMDAWIAEAIALRRRMAAEHRAELDRLRRAALPYAERDRGADEVRRERLRLALQGARREHADIVARRPELEFRSSRLARLAAKIAEVEVSVAPRFTWRFGDSGDQRWHDALTSFLGRRRELDRWIARVRSRRRLAASVEADSIVKFRLRWRRTLDAIASNPRYAGCRLRPQLGLVPLGPDPDSGLEEFAQVQTGEIPPRDAAGRLVRGDDTAVVLVLLPGGRFRMGSPAHQEYAEHDEGPVADPVRIDPFFLSKYEMTQRQWVRLTGRNPSRHCAGSYLGRAGSDLHPLRHPVESVSWSECVRTLANVLLDLPTEAEWEYAARAGTGGRWWTGDDPASLEGAANIADQKLAAFHYLAPVGFLDYVPWTDGFAVHGPVGSLRPNAFGLHDVLGNVGEWCADLLGDYRQPPSPGRGLFPAAVRYARCYRGGSFLKTPPFVRCADRYSGLPEERSAEIGVRPARRIDPPRHDE